MQTQFLQLPNGGFTFSAGLLGSLETLQVELLVQNLEHSKCLKTAPLPLSEGDSLSQHLEAPPGIPHLLGMSSRHP